ncbi:amine oxidase [flavin-containing] B-like [Ptychodera flava]|uniref:amine oxidase [flavin-containing] B-like n=1 Tax=Ptychodera flava TaxID=63121 RepID=UPI00396A69D3
MPHEKDVIIVGAGLSGLSAAKLLKEQGIDVVILEAKDRVGGRTYTLKGSNYGYADAGAEYFGAPCRRLLRMMKEFGIEHFPMYQEGVRILEVAGSTYRGENGKLNMYNPITILDMNHFGIAVDEVTEKISLHSPWDSEDAEYLDSITMDEWLNKTMWTAATREFGRFMVFSILFHEADVVSALFFFWYIKTGKGFRTIMVTAQNRRAIGGTQQVSERIAESLNGAVMLNSPVVSVEDSSRDITVTTKDGAEYKANHVIMALPPALQSKIAFNPQLPVGKQEMIRLIEKNVKRVRGLYKMIVFYKRAFWREKGYSGDVFCANSFMRAIIDNTKADGSYPALQVVCDGRSRETMTKDERVKKICEHAAKHFDCEEALHPLDVVCYDFFEDEYTACCINVLPPGALTKYGRYLRSPHGNVYFAGTETATEFSTWMNGAIEAGERAAREVLHAIGKIGKDEIWQEEPECPDLPDIPVTVPLLDRMLPSVTGLLRFLGGVALIGGVVAAAIVQQRMQ